MLAGPNQTAFSPELAVGESFLIAGDALRKLGRMPEAVDAYERYVDDERPRALAQPARHAQGVRPREHPEREGPAPRQRALEEAHARAPRPRRGGGRRLLQELAARDTIRPGKKGAENRDYERIGSEFHRWVRDQTDRLGLATSDDFVRFVERDLDFYAGQTKRIREAGRTLTAGLESIRYNEERGFTLQTQALLSPLEPKDSAKVVTQKLALVADYLDIWLARRMWNFRTVGQSAVRYRIFQLGKELRGKSIEELSEHLQADLAKEEETFASNVDLRLHQTNYRQVRHILARLTQWVDDECGVATHFENLVSEGRAKPFEIEHIWANQYARYAEWFAHAREFESARNRLGGLVLLQRGHNQKRPTRMRSHVSRGHAASSRT